MINIGNKIRDIRKQRSLNSKELATKINVSPGFLSQLETGVKTPSLETLEQICIALEISLSAFFDVPTGKRDNSCGAIIKAFRRFKGISIKEIANQICTSESVVISWEEEGYKPTISNLIEISSILGIKTDTLIGIVTKEANIHKLLHRYNISINDLAKKTNIDRKTLDDILKNHIIPSLEQVRRICDSLGISLVEFYGEGIDFLTTKQIAPDLKELLESEQDLLFNSNVLTSNDKKEIMAIVDYQISKRKPKGVS